MKPSVRNFLLLGWLCFGLILPNLAHGYGYQYMKENRKRANESAAKLYLSKDMTSPKPYTLIEALQTQTKKADECEKKLRRLAWRKGADAIMAYRLRALEPKGPWQCSGQAVRWNSS